MRVVRATSISIERARGTIREKLGRVHCLWCLLTEKGASGTYANSQSRRAEEAVARDEIICIIRRDHMYNICRAEEAVVREVRDDADFVNRRMHL